MLIQKFKLKQAWKTDHKKHQDMENIRRDISVTVKKGEKQNLLEYWRKKYDE